MTKNVLLNIHKFILGKETKCIISILLHCNFSGCHVIHQYYKTCPEKNPNFFKMSPNSGDKRHGCFSQITRRSLRKEAAKRPAVRMKEQQKCTAYTLKSVLCLEENTFLIDHIRKTSIEK